MSSPDKFGHIEGFPVGSLFEKREALVKAKVHKLIWAGISGNAEKGAYSIVMSGGYEDDDDNGNTIEYTAAGGQGDYFEKKKSNAQIQDQTWGSTHKTLMKSIDTKRPVRVIRGADLKSRYSPQVGYDGLYTVTEVYAAVGLSGYLVWKFHLECLSDQPPIPTNW